MPSARTLTTTELGQIRYSQAISANTWPVQVIIKPNSHDTQFTLYKFVITGVADTPFRHSCHGDLRVTVPLPPGTHKYSIYRDALLLSSHQMEVGQGQVPIGTTKLAKKLEERPPSGIAQISDAINGKATVRFLYTEETYSVREVYAIGNGLNLKLQREQSGDFVGISTLQLGNNDIRFRVIPREWTPPRSAVFTRLGWDDSAGERGELVTWPLLIDVRQFVNSPKEQVDDGDKEQVHDGGRGASDALQSSNAETQDNKSGSGLDEIQDNKSGGGLDEIQDNKSGGGLGGTIVGIACLVAGFGLTIVLHRGDESVDEEQVVQMRTTGVSIGRDNISSDVDVLKHLQSCSQ